MANTPIAPTRKELEQFIQDPRTVRALEEVFAVLEENISILNDFNDIITNLLQKPEVLANVFIRGAEVEAEIIDETDKLIASSVDLADNTGVANATMNNGPTAGDPTKWIEIDDNGTTRYIPTWT